MLLWFAIVLITRRVFVSSALCGLTVGAVIVANNLNHEYTAVVALPIDAYAAIGVVYDLSTFVGYVELHMAEMSALAVLCGLVVLGFLKEPVLFAWSRRTLAIGAVYVAAVTWFYYPVTSRDAPIQRLYRTAGAEFDGEYPNDSVVELGLFAHLLVAALEFFPELPIDYGDRDLFLEHFQATAATGPPTPASSPQPNIVVVLSESLFDPRGLNVSIEPTLLTELDELANHADYHGTLRVHTIGGGTVRAEYSLLTGIPTSIIGQGGQWPFSSLVTESTWSLAKHLKSIGYRTVAVYPAPGSLFNARRAYRLLGFDEFIDIRQFDPEGDFGTRYVTDAAIARKVVQSVGDGDQPVFVMALTMETHGPWSLGAWADERRYRVTGSLSADNRDALEDYVHRLRTVEGLATTIHEYLAAQDRPFVFSLFGDHLPAMFEVFEEVGFRDDLSDWINPRFQTPYFVTGNTDAITEPRERHVDVSFLGSLVLDAAGVNSGEFFRMSSTYREFCGGSFGSCREGQRYQQSYVQILFDRLREQLRDDRARGVVATNAMMPTYRLGDIVRVGSEHFGAGWAPESWGAWTVDPAAHLNLRLQSVPADGLVMAARVRLSRTLDSARILINGEPLVTWSFGPSAPHLRQVIIPADRIPADGSLRLTFDLTVPWSPRELGIGSDERRLGVALYGIRLCERSAGECLVPES